MFRSRSVTLNLQEYHLEITHASISYADLKMILLRR